MKGLEILLRSIAQVKRQINPALGIAGIIFTMAERRANFTKEIISLVENAYGENISEISLPELYPPDFHPFEVRDMVDSNLEQREKLLPSEKVWAYRVKMEALNHSGVKGDRYSCGVMVEQTGESKNQIYRLIRLTELVPDLLDKVDTQKL